MKSGTATITVYNGDNSIIISGANKEVSIAYIKKNLNYIKDADFIMLQLEIPLETVEYIISYTIMEGIPIMLNPVPAKALSHHF